jgi:hypothetical protein
MMSPGLLKVLIVGPALAVVAALFLVMWKEHRSPREAAVAIVAGGALAIWFAVAAVLGSRGVFLQPDPRQTPPIAINLLVVFAGLTAALVGSPSLRRLLSNQRNLIRLNVWRLVGVVFLLLMLDGQMPALWALPAGIGDILVGAAAFWVASDVDSPRGRRRAVIFNLLGLADLIVAVGLGVATGPGPAQLFSTTPSSQRATQFPLSLVPTFLVPLAVMLHVVSLWQLLAGSWRSATGRATGDLTPRPIVR